MKITVITRDDGEIVGTVRSTSSTVKSQEKGHIEAEVVPLPGQVMLELDVPDDIMRIENPDELHRRQGLSPQTLVTSLPWPGGASPLRGGVRHGRSGRFESSRH